MILEMSRKTALKLGLLVCETCHLPPNNHFNYTGACAHNSKCKKYVEGARLGIKIVKTDAITK